MCKPLCFAHGGNFLYNGDGGGDGGGGDGDGGGDPQKTVGTTSRIGPIGIGADEFHLKSSAKIKGKPWGGEVCTKAREHAHFSGGKGGNGGKSRGKCAR